MDKSVVRVLDANANRAREALRVIEEYARFVCDDAVLTESLKRIRHELTDTLAPLLPDSALAARDIESDVGLGIRTLTEISRSTLDSVVGAAFGRLGECLRVLCEFSKLIDSAAAQRFDELRYRVYALEPAIRLRSTRRAALRKSCLYVILTESLCRHAWQETAKAVVAAGAGALQLREKSLPDAELLRRACWLRELTQQHQRLLFINDRPDIAALARADGVHAGQEDLDVASLRRIVGGAQLIGLSTHSTREARAALRQSPDYIAVGPMFPSPTKPAVPVTGVDTLAAIRAETDAVIVAIGGINVERAAQVMAAGADVLCVSSAIIGADDPHAATRRLVAATQAAGAG